MKKELETRVGLVTSSLPRKRSTTELLQLMSLFRCLIDCEVFAPRSENVVERKTGLEPATYSLEGYRSTKWATSAFQALDGGEEWTRTTELRRGQIYSLLQLPLCDFPISFNRCISVQSPSRWRDSNPRQADYKSATLPTELHRLDTFVSNNSALPRFSSCKDTPLFESTKTFFQIFPLSLFTLLIFNTNFSKLFSSFSLFEVCISLFWKWFSRKIHHFSSLLTLSFLPSYSLSVFCVLTNQILQTINNDIKHCVSTYNIIS